MDWVVSIPDDGLETLISAILTTMGPKRNLRGHNRIVSEKPNEVVWMISIPHNARKPPILAILGHDLAHVAKKWYIWFRSTR